MNKKLIRLTESDLHKIVKESVEKILRESGYEYGKTIAHLPSADTPLSSKPKDAIYKIAQEYIDFRNKNPKLVQTILKPSNYYDDGNYDEFKNDNEKLRRIFAEKMGYDYDYIYPVFRVADLMMQGDFDPHSNPSHLSLLNYTI